MSYMKQAWHWMEENGLTNHPDALSMYLKTIKKEDDGNTKGNHSEKPEHTKTMPGGLGLKS